MATSATHHEDGTISRRVLMRRMGLAALTFWLPARWSLGLASDADPEPSAETLRAFVDTLLPGSDVFPPASALGVDRSVLEAAQSDPGLARLIGAGCQWLDRAARSMGAGSFSELSGSGRASIISVAEHSAERSLPWVLFSSVRRFSFQKYYSAPESWGPLAYAGPPQPLGFPGHDRSPKETA